jgi:hypothetical protein
LKVWTEVPAEWEELIERAMKIEGWVRKSQYFRELIREDLKRKRLLGIKTENGREEKEAVVVEG